MIFTRHSFTLHLVYSLWGEWTECPVTCGGGVQYHDRNKTIVTTNGIHVSFEDESRYCNTQPCPPGNYLHVLYRKIPNTMTLWA